MAKKEVKREEIDTEIKTEKEIETELKDEKDFTRELPSETNVEKPRFKPTYFYCEGSWRRRSRSAEPIVQRTTVSGEFDSDTRDPGPIRLPYPESRGSHFRRSSSTPTSICWPYYVTSREAERERRVGDSPDSDKAGIFRLLARNQGSDPHSQRAKAGSVTDSERKEGRHPTQHMGDRVGEEERRAEIEPEIIVLDEEEIEVEIHPAPAGPQAEELLSDSDSDGDGDILPAIMAVQGNQLTSIPIYSGTQGLEALNYAEAIDGALVQFGWTQAQAAQAAISRGGTTVANWTRGERAAGITYTAWNQAAAAGVVNMRPAFITRFGPVYTTSGAVSAIADLKQRQNETAADFMDRVKVSVDMLHYNVAEADRNNAFRQSYARLVVAQFGGGIHDTIRRAVFGVPVPPNTIQAALEAATAAEAEQSSKTTKLVNEIEEGELTENADTSDKPKPTEFELLTKKVDDVLAISRQGGLQRARGRGGFRPDYSQFRCYNCNNIGHLRRNCPKPQSSFQVAGRGHGNSRGYTTRRGRYQQNFGPGRARPFNYSQGGNRGRSATFEIDHERNDYGWDTPFGPSGNGHGEWY